MVIKIFHFYPWDMYTYTYVCVKQHPNINKNENDTYFTVTKSLHLHVIKCSAFKTRGRNMRIPINPLMYMNPMPSHGEN